MEVYRKQTLGLSTPEAITAPKDFEWVHISWVNSWSKLQLAIFCSF